MLPIIDIMGDAFDECSREGLQNLRIPPLMPLKGGFGELSIEVPRNGLGSFESQFIGNHQTHWAGIYDKLISLYA